MDVANFLGLKEINVALNVLLAVALVVVLVTLIETRIQLIGRIGKCAMSVRWSVGRFFIIYLVSLPCSYRSICFFVFYLCSNPAIKMLMVVLVHIILITKYAFYSRRNSPEISS